MPSPSAGLPGRRQADGAGMGDGSAAAARKTRLARVFVALGLSEAAIGLALTGLAWEHRAAGPAMLGMFFLAGGALMLAAWPHARGRRRR